MSNEGISIVIPVYNEQEALKETIQTVHEAIKNIPDQKEIIVVNDGSSDKTKETLKEINNIQVINNPYNLGYGASLKKGIKAAKYNWILITDADGTYPVKDIPKLIGERANYDMIVGARTKKNVHVPALRKPAKWILTQLAQFLTQKKIPDLNSGLRIFKKDIAMEFWHLFPSRFSFTTTITLACLTNDYLVKFIPIDYYKRKGKSTVRPINDFMHFNKVIFKIVLYFNPLRFFLWPGAILTIAGIIYGFYQVLVSTPGNLGQFPFILFLAGIQIIMLGLLAEIMVKSRK
ncbi:MAG: glycosyltransferase family 2 protein [Nanoarchaeota archaeon]|nr:glycosyltransferase family 2 protein [Nanoarchaeota archaeon]